MRLNQQCITLLEPWTNIQLYESLLERFWKVGNRHDFPDNNMVDQVEYTESDERIDDPSHKGDKRSNDHDHEESESMFHVVWDERILLSENQGNPEKRGNAGDDCRKSILLIVSWIW